MIKTLLFLTTITLSFLGFSQENISLTYVGNMGVYISNDQSSFLIDGLHLQYGEDYLFPDEKLVHKIKTVLKPDAILFTHYHGDHFSKELSINHLQLNKETILFGASQVTSGFEKFNDRVITIATKDYNRQSHNLKNLKITGLKINHAGKRHISVENVGYIVNIADKNILHVGDTNWLEEINLFEQLKLFNESIDIAILPYWMLMDTRASELIKKYIHPNHVVATHISPRIKQEELQSLKNKFPKVYFLTELEQQIQL
ncbi:MBL fold metallo-hydrolase [Aquimarina sp. 2304DJ70-9]|uniref:MBL fold metallo-hydrolase n=1 Tax=Aquimarina penaris TaxID=3231044 RepID=UPI003462A74C